MTPRSRKPVMVLTTTVSSTDHNQTINQTDLSDFREQEEEEDVEVDDDDVVGDEDDSDDDVAADAALNVINHPPQPEVINEDATSLGGYSDIFKRRQLLQANQSFVQQSKISVGQVSLETDSSSNSNSNSNDSNEEKEKLRQKRAADELSAHFK